MLKPNVALTMFPILIPKIAISGTSLQKEKDESVEASPFYVRRVALDGKSKKLVVQLAQAESGMETMLEIPPSENQPIVYRALELAMATNTPVLVCVEEEKAVTS